MATELYPGIGPDRGRCVPEVSASTAGTATGYRCIVIPPQNPVGRSSYRFRGAVSQSYVFSAAADTPRITKARAAIRGNEWQQLLFQSLRFRHDEALQRIARVCCRLRHGLDFPGVADERCQNGMPGKQIRFERDVPQQTLFFAFV